MKKSLLVITTLFLSSLLYQCKHAPNDIPTPVKKVASTSTPPVALPGNLADSVCFSDQILPLLISNCAQAGCHDDTTRRSGVNVSSYSKTISTLSGKMLVSIIQDTGSNRMPPRDRYAPLTSAQIQIVKNWVNQGMKNGIDCPQSCDSLNITFAGTINPIIQNNCLGCHSASSAITILKAYTDIKAKVNDGKLLCSVTQRSGCLPMPQGAPMLSDCKIKQIKAWIAAGAPNN